jgi:hypothetical protein
MTKFLRKYQKQVLAVFTVMLMVMFAFNPNSTKSRSSTRLAIGSVGKEVVYRDQKTQAASDWQMLQRVDAMIPFLHSRYDPGRISPMPQPAMYVYELGEPIVAEINKNPELYLLLQLEAEQRGIGVSVDQVGTVMQNDLFTEGDQQFTPISPETVGQDNYDALRMAVARFLPVVALVNRVESDVKITQPIARRVIAAEQLVQLAIVDLPADHFQKSVAAPTPQQLQAQYEAFRDRIAPTDHPADDPLGFGYKLPERVKLQYLTIPRDQLLKAVRANKSAYDWEVDERVYYYAHQDEFVGLPPAPATAPTTKPTTDEAAAATQPTTRPFAEVQDKVASAVMAAPMADLAQQIASAISARLATDLKASQAPATDLAIKAYLDAVALDIQKKFAVFPVVTQTGDWLDAKALGQLPGIGEAMADDKSLVALAFPDAPASALAMLEPSPLLKDAEGNTYIFRITQRDPAHSPPLSEVQAKVEADYRLAKSYAAAVDAGKALLDSAGKQGLSSAALAQNLPVISTTPFQPGSGEPIPQYPLNSDSQAAAEAKAAELLSQATVDNPHPLALVELPADKKTSVMQLANVSSRVPPGEMYLLQFTGSLTEARKLSQGVASRYFSYDAVKSRLNYVPIDTSADKAGL